MEFPSLSGRKKWTQVSLWSFYNQCYRTILLKSRFFFIIYIIYILLSVLITVGVWKPRELRNHWKVITPGCTLVELNGHVSFFSPSVTTLWKLIWIIIFGWMVCFALYMNIITKVHKSECRLMFVWIFCATTTENTSSEDNQKPIPKKVLPLNTMCSHIQTKCIGEALVRSQTNPEVHVCNAVWEVMSIISLTCSNC